ncbi:MAG: hypothetical protein IKU29_06685, partial [Parabacteroides sp.]|nr:hypothetical protein [Parabacteroides sp.]
EKYYFEYFDKQWKPSSHLKDLLKEVHKRIVKQYGEFPGKPVKFPEKEQKEKKKNSYAVFCPNCDYEMKITKKMLEKHSGGLPTCPCGAKMGIAYEDDETEEKEG